MLSKNKIKWIRSLDSKKNRVEEGLFLAEGNKIVHDLLPYFKCRLLVATAQWLAGKEFVGADEVVEATRDEISQASLMKSPQEVLALFEMPKYGMLSEHDLKGKLTLALDTVQDPGNLGTIIRIADWYGIEQIVCSTGSADVYNPKVVQATMGALARVRVYYTDLSAFLSGIHSLPLYGTFLDGHNMYDTKLSKEGIIVMGNEGNGISNEIERFISHKLFIPNYPPERDTSESLNVAVATAIICAEFRRQS